VSNELKLEDLDLKNGANLIVENEREEILAVREKTRKQAWILPGGEVERGEKPSHAAQSETEEETGIVTDVADYTQVAMLVQRPKGLVVLYSTKRYKGNIIISPHSQEVQDARFMSFREIMQLAERDEFRTGYVRMVLRYMRCKYGIDPTPFEGALRDAVEYPADLDFAHYREKIRSV
jgi:ADP-ribose pyrophosphatase YjhB (NUDIX family)